MLDTAASSHPTVAAPTFEQHATGFGISIALPRLSWSFRIEQRTARDWEQAAYDIEIQRGRKTSSWHVSSNASVLVPWPDTPLSSREQAKVRVRVYSNEASEPSEWSPSATVECGLLERSDWLARPVTGAECSESSVRPLRFRRRFTAPSNLDHCRLYITSLGVYRAWINGQPVGDHFMAPGWTSYNHRLNYEVFDVGPHIRPEELNVIAVEVAEGWYAGRLGFCGGRSHIYGREVGPMVQLEMGLPGSAGACTVVTDASWSYRNSAIVSSGIYDGETYDMREEDDNWAVPAGPDQGDSWPGVKALQIPASQLVTSDAPPVRVTEEVTAVALIKSPSGRTILDFGQNLVGRILVKSLRKPSGHAVTFTHAEVLEHGELGIRPLRGAACTDTVISDGEELKGWCPQFTFHGFRYVLVEGWSAEDKDSPLLFQESLCAQVLHTDLKRTGHFSCSHPLVNRLHENACWSMRGNFLSIPTDCPQRDERLGWTGDLQIFCPSASFLYNTAGMLGDWLKDLDAEQFAEGLAGVPPFVVPNVIQIQWPDKPQAVWGDVAVLTPWDLYQAYGDEDILRRQYRSMTAWVDHAIRRGRDGLWDEEMAQLGDWLDPTAPPDEPANARTTPTLVADAYLVHVTSTLAQISAILGMKDDAVKYASDARRLKTTFQSKYISPLGLVVGDSQTALSLAIVFGLHATTEQVAEAGDRLAHLVRLAKFRVATGFAGTPEVTRALTQTGHYQLAYRMLREKNCPSWMYPITMGATTVWERWNSMLPDGSINPGEMTSFNHYALGAIIRWLHETVAGLAPIAPGWKLFKVAPIPGGELRSAEATYETPYGRAECRWSICNNDHFELEVLVPANTQAIIILPHEHAAYGQDVSPTEGASAGKRVVGSGRHHFVSKWSSSSQWPPEPLTFRRDDSISIV